MNTVLALLAKGDMNCAGEEISNSLFDSDDNKSGVQTADLHKTPRNPNDIQGRGVVQTEAEKKLAEEEARRAEEERLHREEEERRERERQEAEERRRNSPLRKALRWIKDFGKTITDDEE